MREKTANHPLPVIFFTLFLNALGFGILIPIIPLLLVDPRSSFFLLPNGFSLNQGYILFGFLTAIFPLMQFFSTPILGQLSDRYGRKYPLALSLAGTSLSYIVFEIGILTRNLPLLFLSRALDGITGGNISIAQAAVADITTPENRTKNFGLVGASFGLGFVLGPYIGGKLSDPSIISWFNPATPFLFAAILAFLNVLSVILFLPETHLQRIENLVINWGKSIKNIVHAYAMEKLRPLFLTSFLFNSGFTFFTTFSAVFMIKKFNFTQGNVGDFFSYVGVWLALSQALLTRLVSKKVSETKVLDFSLFGVSVALLFFFLTHEGWQLLLIAPFLAAFIGLSIANLTSLISRSVDRSIQGEILGINASVQGLAQTIPPVLSGFIAASLTPESPIIVSAAVVLMAGLTFILTRKAQVSQTSQAPA